MVDPVSLAAAVKEAIDAGKGIVSLAKGARDRKVNEHILVLQERLIEVQRLVMEISGENHALASKLREFERVNEIAGEMVLEHSMYWTMKRGKKEGPFCPVCWGSNRKVIPITEGLKGNFTCWNCKGQFRTPGAESAIAFAVVKSQFTDFEG